MSRHLSDSLADVLEEAVSGVLPLVGVHDPVAVQVPHLDVAICRARAKQGLIEVHGHTLDGVLMGLMDHYSLIITCVFHEFYIYCLTLNE